MSKIIMKKGNCVRSLIDALTKTRFSGITAKETENGSVGSGCHHPEALGSVLH